MGFYCTLSYIWFVGAGSIQSISVLFKIDFVTQIQIKIVLILQSISGARLPKKSPPPLAVL